MTITELLVRIVADVEEVAKGLAQVKQWIAEAGEAADKMGVQFDAAMVKSAEGAKVAATAIKAYAEELAAVEAQTAVMSGKDPLAAMRVKFSGILADGELEKLRAAHIELEGIERQVEVLNRFERELGSLSSRVAMFGGSDPLASLRFKFSNLVPDSELQKMVTLQKEMEKLKDLSKFDKAFTGIQARGAVAEGSDPLAALRHKFGANVPEGSLAQFASAEAGAKEMEKRLLEAERFEKQMQKLQGELSVLQNPTSLGKVEARFPNAPAQKAENMRAIEQEIEGQRHINAFQEEFAATTNRLSQMKGNDKTAFLQQKFGGFVSEEDLMGLREAGLELKQLQHIHERFYDELASKKLELGNLQASTPMLRAREAITGDATPRLMRQFQGVTPDEIEKLAAQEAMLRRARAADAIPGQALEVGGQAAQGLFAVGALAAFDFTRVENALANVRGNTTLSNAEFKAMGETVKRLAAETGEPIERIAAGYEHVSNFGFKNAEAQRIVAVATHAAATAQADAGTTAQLLAKIMRENNIPLSQTEATMNKLTYASANSDSRLRQLIETGGRAFNMASTVGLGFNEAAAALSLYMARGLDAHVATTNLVGDMNKLISPTKGVHDELVKLTKKTGVDLVGDFSLAGIRTKGLSGAFHDLRTVADELGMPVAKLAKDLFPAMRGTLGGLIGTSDEGIKGLDARLRDLNDSSKLAQQQQERHTVAFASTERQLKILLQTIRVEFLPVGQEFAQMFKEAIPGIKIFADVLKATLEGFLKLPGPVKEVILSIGGIGLAMSLLGNPFNATFLLVGNLIKLWQGVASAATTASVAESVGVALGTRSGYGALAGLPGVVMPAATGGGLAAGAAALAPLAGIVAVAGGEIFLLKKAYDALNPSLGKTNDQLVAESRALSEVMRGTRDNSAQMLALTGRYTDLHNIAQPTRAEMDEMRRVLDQISVLNPQLVSGFDRQGHAIGLVANALDRATESYRNLNREQALALARTSAQETQGLRAQRDTLSQELKKQQFLLTNHQAVDPNGQIYPVDVNRYPANLDNPLLIKSGRFAPFGLGGDTNYSLPRTIPATPEQQQEYAARVRELTAQIAALDRTTTENNAHMRAVLGPSGPLHTLTGSAAHPGVTFAHPEDARRVNQQLLTDMRQIAAEMGISLRIGTAIAGHNVNTINGRRSRHADGNAFDIDMINGRPANTHDTVGAALADRFVAALEARGFSRNNESGQDHAVLWRTMMGGNHFNHVHVSEQAGGAVSAIAKSAGEAWYDKMKEGSGRHKKSDEDKEEDRFLAEKSKLVQALTLARNGEVTAVHGFEMALRTLTPAHRAELQAMIEKLKGMDAAILSRKQQQKQEESFHAALEIANNRIRATRGEEEGGLEALKKKYPDVSNARLKYLLSQQQSAKASETEKETVTKLSTTLRNFQSELDGGTQKTGVHALAIQLTGHAYESLSSNAKLLLGFIAQIKTQIASNDAVSKATDYLQNAQASLALMSRPKDEREVIKRLASGAEAATNTWNGLTQAVQQNLLASYAQGAAYEDQAKKIEKAEEVLKSFHAEMDIKTNAAAIRAGGDKEEAAFQMRMGDNGGALADAFALHPEQLPQARAQFHDRFSSEEQAKKLEAAKQALEGFNAQANESIAALQFAIGGKTETAEGQWAQFLSKNRGLAEHFTQDTNAGTQAFAKFKNEFDLKKQVEALDKFRSSVSGAQKEWRVLTAGSDFAKFKASLLELDKDGNLKQIFSEDQLKKMFKWQEQLKVGKQFADGLQGIFHTMFSDLMKGGKNLFTNLETGFLNLFQQIATDYLASQFYNFVMRSLGGVLGPIGGVGAAAGGLPTGGISVSGGLAAFAEGGPVMGGRAVLVGERGPEVFVPHSAGNILPNRAMMGSNIIVQMNVQSPDVRSFNQSQPQVMHDIFRNTTRAAQRSR